MRTIILALGLIIVLAGCGGTENGASGDPAAAVERYLTASVEADADVLASVICAELEAEIDAAARRFATVSGVRLEGMACAYDEATSTVTCDGEIIATYGTSDTAFSLGTYRVVQEDGEWKWCGEA